MFPNFFFLPDAVHGQQVLGVFIVSGVSCIPSFPPARSLCINLYHLCSWCGVGSGVGLWYVSLKRPSAWASGPSVCPSIHPPTHCCCSVVYMLSCSQPGRDVRLWHAGLCSTSNMTNTWKVIQHRTIIITYYHPVISNLVDWTICRLV